MHYQCNLLGCCDPQPVYGLKTSGLDGLHSAAVDCLHLQQQIEPRSTALLLLAGKHGSASHLYLYLNEEKKSR